MCTQEKPYLMKKADSDDREGNDRFEGYIVDLLEQLAHKARFTYSITLVKDGKYGRRMEDGRWIGMIREVIESVCNQLFQSNSRLI